ncbi:MAG: RNA 2',3'-cyclic phosphodiesterase [Betaproteobacteria bacterium]|nr:RNA 2',3'-cyclic phosphodiesterase [Betaproteobacteria bacterium]
MRLFFALWPPRRTAELLADWAAEAQRVTRGRVTRAEAIHLTLAFLGEVAEERLAAAVRAARRVRAEPHDLPIEQARLWTHHRIVWVGPRETPPALQSVADLLRTELAIEGFSLERRPFAAHITLIRKARGTGTLPPLPSVDWPVSEVALVRSTLSQQGPNYEVIARFALLRGE